MEKRQFLSSAAGMVAGALGSSLNVTYAHNNQSPASQTILTIVGNIENVNRKKLNVVTDQLMYKQGVRFNRAYTFSLADLEKLPAVSISPTMEYDAQVHELSGPRLIDVLGIVGIGKSKAIKIVWRSIDGYSPEISFSRARKYDYILATRIDGQLLSIGGFGPLFGIYDADRIADFSKKPLSQRFQACPWGLYCIEVV